MPRMIAAGKGERDTNQSEYLLGNKVMARY
jgi:hypothetical protein